MLVTIAICTCTCVGVGSKQVILRILPLLTDPNVSIDLLTGSTVLLLKIQHGNNNNCCLSFAEFLEVNIQHSIPTRILFPYIVYTCDDLCRIIRDYFQSFGKGCRVIL